MEVFETLPGPFHLARPDLRLLYIGTASNLRRRIRGDHIRRSGTSTLRRTLAGLLLETERYQTTWTDRVVLVPSDEVRLTEWMQRHLQLNWVIEAESAPVETRLIAALQPPLNARGIAAGATADTIRQARSSYRRSTVAEDSESPQF